MTDYTELDHTVAAQIKFTNMTRARDCAQWLIKNIGPQQPGTVGNIVRGEGWLLRVMDMTPSDPIVAIELNQHVDPHDVTMFLLRWA